MSSDSAATCVYNGKAANAYRARHKSKDYQRMVDETIRKYGKHLCGMKKQCIEATKRIDEASPRIESTNRPNESNP